MSEGHGDTRVEQVRRDGVKDISSGGPEQLQVPCYLVRVESRASEGLRRNRGLGISTE